MKTNVFGDCDINHIQRAFTDFQSVDLSFVESRMIVQQGLSKQDAETARREFDYLASVAKVFPEKQVVPTKRGDEFWHEFLLFTENYAAWSTEHFGSFVHHVPGETPAEAVEFSMNAYARAFDLNSSEHGASCKRALAMGASCKRGIAVAAAA